MTEHSTVNYPDTGHCELEQLALEECMKRRRIEPLVSALVMPAARSPFVQQLATQGIMVSAGDQPGLKKDMEGRFLASGLKDQIQFLPYTLPALPPPPETGYDVIFLRRGICHLPYAEARQVVRGLLRQLRIGGKLYLSILGLHSELGEGYAGAEQPVDQRYAPLAPEVDAIYHIGQPVCLYTERDIFLLLLTAGASVLRTLTTSYGNVQAVAMRV